MFTWICPKCGKEVPPAYSECPNCVPQERSADTLQTALPPAGQRVGELPSSAVPPEGPAPEMRPAAEERPPAPQSAPVAFAPQVPPPAAPVRRSSAVAIPGWLLSLLIAAVLIIVGLTAILLRNSSRRAAESVPAPVSLEKPAPAAMSDSNPAFRNVELTGVRLTEDAKHKAFVQVLAVNHSAADLGTLEATATLKAVAKQDQEIVGTFAFKTTLGPYEAKEIKAPLNTRLRVYELPDWQFLRVELAK